MSRYGSAAHALLHFHLTPRLAASRSPAQLICVLLLELLVSPVRPGRSPEVVVCDVGGRALLPCSWKESPAHVEWVSRAPYETVYEKWGARTWSSPGYGGRLAITEEQLATGNCTLELRDAQLLDGGEYDSYGIRGEGRVVSRVLVHSVRLTVRDHKLTRSVRAGEGLVLDLYTPHAERVVFQERNGSEWALLWLRGQDSPRLRMSQGREEVVLTGTTLEDQGLYKVLDQHGLAVSTLLVSVHESPSVSEPGQDYKEHMSPAESTGEFLTLPLLHNTYAQLHNTYAQLHNTYTQLYNTYTQLHNTYTLIHTATKHTLIHNTYAQLHNTYTQLHNTLIHNTYTVTKHTLIHNTYTNTLYTQYYANISNIPPPRIYFNEHVFVVFMFEKHL
ncbi:unnamed protein product [Lota lota]